MAWQLIYTSAPRSLEAGRSGFGTVARHRAISPLLVSAIERASQFSRLPGVDTGRVIYCYRIISIAGGRFHVLSSIRDAGADYTGRTNHIAHHLVADPREVAQLGQQGPSPADVLLGMQWATSWTEHPRYFEATEEITLARIPPQAGVNGSAWQQIAGDRNQAWLLASGDASRGAYIIQPPGADLRAIFGESLRLMPERMWQVSFTTSLQPSDEPADFRWIGIEEHSPLRSQAEASGRPLMNLARPDTLPRVEINETPADTRFQRSAGSASSPAFAGDQLPQSEAFGESAARTLGAAPRERRAESPPRRIPSPKPKWLFPVGVGALALIIALGGVFVGFPAFKASQHRKEVRAQIGTALARSGYFSDKVAAELRAADQVDTAKEIADAGDGAASAAQSADFSAMQVRRPDKALRERARTVGLNIPAEINALDERLAKIAEIHQWLTSFTSQPEGNGFEQLEARRSEAEELTKPELFARTKVALLRLADQRRAQALRAMLNGSNDGRMKPREPAKWFEETVTKISVPPEDAETTLIINAIRKLIDDWKFVDAQEPSNVEKRLAQRPEWPAWLKSKAQGKSEVARVVGPTSTETVVQAAKPSAQPSPSDKPAALPRVPLYFVNGKDRLSKTRIDELSPNLKVSLKAGDEKEAELFELNNDRMLRRDYQNPPVFELDPDQKQLRMADGGKQISPPFRISAKDTSGADTFQIWVTGPSGDPLFSTRTTGLNRKGDLLEFNPSLLGFPGTPKNQLLIRLPDSCFATTSSSDAQPLANWSIDLSEGRKQIEKQRAQWMQRLIDLEAKLSEPPKDDRAKFTYLAEELEKEVKFSDEDKKRDFPGSNASIRQRCGGYLLAISRPLKNGGDPVFKAGDVLKTLPPDADAKKETEAVKTAITAVNDAIRGLTTNEEKKAHEGKLKRLLQMLAVLQPETAEAKAAHAVSLEATKKAITEIKSKLSDIHPLVTERVPPGKYKVLVKDGGTEISLVEVHIP